MRHGTPQLKGSSFGTLPQPLLPRQNPARMAGIVTPMSSGSEEDLHPLSATPCARASRRRSSQFFLPLLPASCSAAPSSAAAPAPPGAGPGLGVGGARSPELALALREPQDGVPGAEGSRVLAPREASRASGKPRRWVPSGSSSSTSSGRMPTARREPAAEAAWTGWGPPPAHAATFAGDASASATPRGLPGSPEHGAASALLPLAAPLLLRAPAFTAKYCKYIGCGKLPSGGQRASAFGACPSWPSTNLAIPAGFVMALSVKDMRLQCRRAGSRLPSLGFSPPAPGRC